MVGRDDRICHGWNKRSDKATGFYDTLLDIIDLKRIEKTDTYGSYAPKSNPEAVEFLLQPFQ